MLTVRLSARADEGIASGTYLKLSSVALSLPVATTEIGNLEARKLAEVIDPQREAAAVRLET
jgi:hypothetical protein